MRVPTPSHREKLLIVSSYNRPCGIAQYAEHLLPALREREDFSVEVAELPVSLLRTPDHRAAKLSNEAMRRIARQASEADYVNIQYEPGLFGLTPSSINRNFSLIAGSAKKCLITHHTILYPENNPGILEVLRNPKHLLRMYRQSSTRESNLKIFLKKRRNIRHLVQTKHAREFLNMLGIERECVADHPLAFLSSRDKANMRESLPADRKSICEQLGIAGQSDTVLMGGFGFLSPYKGYETLIHCLRLLPLNYHLVIAGGLHPEGLVKRSTKQPYLRSVMALVDKDLRPKRKKKKTESSDSKLLERVHFVGSLGNKDFARVVNACNFVVLPYSEEMQSSSGPAGLALDLGKRIFCSNNHCFRELRRYAGEAVELFEISNHLELKTKILNDGVRSADHPQAIDRYQRSHTMETRAELYWKLLGEIE